MSVERPGLYEVLTRTIKPGMRREIERRIEERLARRVEVSPLGASWFTEIGALNQLVEVWPYRDLAHRQSVAETLRDIPDWPPDIASLTVGEQVEFCTPAPFGEPLTPGQYGGVFEMRTYGFRPGTMPDVLETWARLVPERVRLSPLVGCWYTQVGVLGRFTHVWGYRSLEERATIRERAVRETGWPPMTRDWRTGEESKILLPSPYSPVR